ncbi:MAG: hypothetical protein AAF628_26690 [Planctomycetota bacterium]
MHSDRPNVNHGGKRTHRDLLPRDVCPSFMMKQILTGSLDNVVWDDRTYPGDGYAWCLRTCKDVGPDDTLVRPEDCRPHRGCWDGPRG